MTQKILDQIEQYFFKDLHPQLSLGTASDRYAGWMGQIYTPQTYVKKIKTRTKTVAGKKYAESLLPVESVSEYFMHFDILEIDYTYYRMLKDAENNPISTCFLLQNYVQHIPDQARIWIKVPMQIFERRIWKGKSYIQNPDYLNATMFKDQFYQPAIDVLRDHLAGFIFEQAYHQKKERLASQEFVAELASFFKKIPPDHRYHLEMRTSAYFTKEYFEFLKTFGIGQVFSHWTWLPGLGVQFEKSGKLFFNASNQVLIRLITPHNVRYEDSYATAFPFDKIISGMMSPDMIDDVCRLIQMGIDQKQHVNLIVNNRCGGNAPDVARMISRVLFESV